jgi:alcohol dehydrogenase (NADP+)
LNGQREPGAHDVLIDIFYRIFHSDIHRSRDERGGGFIFPMVPGHEIVGQVSSAGSEIALNIVAGLLLLAGVI